MTSAGRSPGLLIAVLVGAFAVLALHAASFFPFLADDALISLRYAARLLDGHGLTWTAGPPVEGYSNFLWTVSVAGLGALGLELILAARLLGFACGLATLAAIGWRYRRAKPADIAGAASAALAIALAAPMAAWIPGALEQPLVAALLLWGVVLLDETLQRPGQSRATLGAGLCLGALGVTRPDTPLLVVMLLGAAWWTSRERTTRASLRRVAVTAALPYLALLAFRLVYYDDWVPNTARIKLAWSAHYAVLGVDYVGRGAIALLPVLACIAFLATRSGNPDPSARADVIRLSARLGPAIASWGIYLVAIGGEAFPAYRLFLPVIVLLALLLGDATRAAWGSTRRRGVCLAAAGLAIALSFAIHRADPDVKRAHDERWEWEGKEVGLFLRERFGALDPLLAVEASGAVPYWSGLRCVDLLGLNDRWVGHHPSAEHGQGAPGHETGDADHVLAQRPDLILLIGPRGAVRPLGTPIEVALASHPEFQRGYVPVAFLSPELDRVVTTIYLRRDSARLDWNALRRDAVADGRVRVRPEELPYRYRIEVTR